MREHLDIMLDAALSRACEKLEKDEILHPYVAMMDKNTYVHFNEDFDQDIYGERLKVHFLSLLREEKKFNSISDLVAQINLDIEGARSFLLTLWIKQNFLKSQ